jgi:hypothetical protein
MGASSGLWVVSHTFLGDEKCGSESDDWLYILVTVYI